MGYFLFFLHMVWFKLTLISSFLTGYVSGAYASGIFFEDTFSIAGFNITGMQIALATNATGVSLLSLST